MDTRPCRVVELEQGTSEWHAWRRGGIGASESAAILGENPFKTRWDALLQKVDDLREPTSPAMVRGTELEPRARRAFEEHTGLVFAPMCLQSTQHDWLRASVDGMTPEADRVVEIKCGEGAYKRSRRGRVPPYYMPQLQHILAVTGLDLIDYWCWLPGKRPIHLEVPRDPRHIHRILVAGEAFWAQVVERRARGGE